MKKYETFIGECSKFIDGKGWTTKIPISEIEKKGYKKIEEDTVILTNQEYLNTVTKIREEFEYEYKDKVVLDKEEYEKIKLFEKRVRSGVCFTQKEWFDYCNEDSKKRTSLIVEAKEQGYEQAHKEMLKDCIESNKIAEQIGCDKAIKEIAQQFYDLSNECGAGVSLWKKVRQLAKDLGVEEE